MVDFYESVEKIALYDPLADTLGAAKNGIVEYGYADAVKLAGHSCPTVAGAYLMCIAALKNIYKDELPQRGGIKVCIKGRLGEGVAGVIASVATLITGAAGIGGFAGLAGKYDRRNLLWFEENVSADMVFERVDNGMKAELVYDPSNIKSYPEMLTLMHKISSQGADTQERLRFAELWQDRVKRILLDEDYKNSVSIKLSEPNA